MLLLFILTIFLLLGSAFCSSLEAAIFSVSRIKVEALASQGNYKAKMLLHHKQHMGQAIGTLVILNNLFNIVGSIFVGRLMGDLFEAFWVGVLSGVFTFLVILFGEILPKNFGERYAFGYAMTMSGLLIVLAKIFWPILAVLNFINRLIFSKSEDTLVSEEEIKHLVNQGMHERTIERDEQELIQNVFSLNDKQAKDIMTPRVNVEALRGDLSFEEQKQDIYNSSHSRLPVYLEDYDEIVGFVLLRDALEALSVGKGHLKPTDILHTLVGIKETTRVDSLLIMFRKRRVHMALVQDEFGGTSGVVTLEDVLEELVGEIVDETDMVVDMRTITVAEPGSV